MFKCIDNNKLAIYNIDNNYTNILIHLMNEESKNIKTKTIKAVDEHRRLIQEEPENTDSLLHIKNKYVKIQEIVEMYSNRSCILSSSFFDDLEKSFGSEIYITTEEESYKTPTVVTKTELLRILYNLTKNYMININPEQLSLLQSTIDQGLPCNLREYSTIPDDKADVWGLKILKSLPLKALKVLFTSSTIKQTREYICLTMVKYHYDHAADIIRMCGKSVDVAKMISHYLLSLSRPSAKYFDIFKLAYETYPPKGSEYNYDRNKILCCAISTDITENVDWLYNYVNLVGLYDDRVCWGSAVPNKELAFCLFYKAYNHGCYGEFEVDVKCIKSFKMFEYIKSTRRNIEIKGDIVENENIFYDAVAQNNGEIVEKCIKNNFTNFCRPDLYDGVEPYVMYMTEDQKKDFYGSFIDWVVKEENIDLLDKVDAIPIKFRVVKVDSIVFESEAFLEKLIFTEFMIHRGTEKRTIKNLIKKAKSLDINIGLTHQMIVYSDKNSTLIK